MKARSTKKFGKATSRSTKAGKVSSRSTKVGKVSSRSTKASSAKPTATKASTATMKRTTQAKSEPDKSRVFKTGTPKPKATPLGRSRSKSLRNILLAKREAIMKQMREQLGQSLTDDQQRRLESAMDSGDQALFDLEREMGISLQEMRNRERQMIEEALSSLEEGTYGQCAECDAEISEKRLQALPFARYCIECQSRLELLEKIEKGEQRT